MADKPKFEWKSGALYKCAVSKSPGYKRDQVYECYKNEQGQLCLRGSDGFEDLCSMLVSGFVVV